MPERLTALFERARDLAHCAEVLPKRQRAKASAQLAAVQNEIAALVTPPEYKGPLATWG